MRVRSSSRIFLAIASIACLSLASGSTACVAARGGDDGGDRRSGASSAHADATTGVVFVHGTSDHTPSSAVDAYWTSDALDAYAAGIQRLVVGYLGSSHAAYEPEAWGEVASQIDAWTQSTGVSRIVVVTHSNGINVVRYLAHHPNANEVTARVVSKFVQIVALAGDSLGTPLADKVTTSSTAASIANSVARSFGLADYKNASVWAQRTDRMAVQDDDGTFDDANGDRGSTTISGIPTIAVSGTTVYAAIWSSDAYCGGYGMTAGLKATLAYGWGWNGCADGFVGCDSAQYVGYAPDRGVGVADGRLNHQQSRRACHGVGDFVSGVVQGIFGAPTANADHVVPPSAQACNATVRTWDATGRYYWYGCPDGALTDGVVEADCFVAYGHDEALVAPDDYGKTEYASLGCDDGKLGDGTCDLCLIAKYGFDVRPGAANGADDCVQQTTNACRDVAFDRNAGRDVIATYVATHGGGG